jgi:hypothetical protein
MKSNQHKSTIFGFDKKSTKRIIEKYEKVTGKANSGYT